MGTRVLWEQAAWYWKETSKVLDRTNAKLEELIRAFEGTPPPDDENRKDETVGPRL